MGLYRIYYRAERFITPGLQNAQSSYFEVLESKLSANVRWLDIGCGRRLCPEWMPRADQRESLFRGKVHRIFGIDPDLASLRDNRFVQFHVAGDSASLPFATSSFDLLTANMVVEHVAHPEKLLSEAHRVLKPNGLFLVHTPNILSYATALSRLVPEGLKVLLIGFLEGRKEEDVFPTLYRMNTGKRFRELSERAGFDITELRYVESSAQFVMLGPLVLAELLWIRLLRFPHFQRFRSNLVVILRRAGES